MWGEERRMEKERGWKVRAEYGGGGEKRGGRGGAERGEGRPLYLQDINAA